MLEVTAFKRFFLGLSRCWISMLKVINIFTKKYLKRKIKSGICRNKFLRNSLVIIKSGFICTENLMKANKLKIIFRQFFIKYIYK